MAAASDNIPERVLGLIDSSTVGFINTTFANLWGAINTSFRSLLILFLILYGIAIWRGLVKTPVQDLVWAFLKFSIIYGLVSQIAIYNTYIVNFLTNTPDSLAGVIVGNGTATSTASSSMGEVFITAIDAADNAMSMRGWFLPYILGGIILLTATLMVLYALFLISLSKIALALLVGVGPLFIILLIFKSTQKIFEAWLQQVINYMLILVLTVATLGLMTAIAQNSVSVIPDANITLGSIMPAAVVFLIVFLLLTQVMTIASALAGGLALSTQHVGAIAGYKGSQALKSVTNGTVGRGSKALGRKGWSAIQNRFNRGSIRSK